MNESERAFEKWARSEEGLQGSDNLGLKIWLAACRWRAMLDVEIAIAQDDRDGCEECAGPSGIAREIRRSAGLP